ncbi:MAG: hypothetical protein ACTSW2_08435, partial [Alphaproteobacteria bacterium]
ADSAGVETPIASIREAAMVIDFKIGGFMENPFPQCLSSAEAPVCAVLTESTSDHSRTKSIFVGATDV